MCITSIIDLPFRCCDTKIETSIDLDRVSALPADCRR
jgi:hypothetical protein